MTINQPSGITQLLAAVGQGDAEARDKLWALIYDELHRVAQHQMADEAPGRTLQTTALVNEAYLRLVGGDNVQWANRRHFFAAAAKAMRHIRVDYARKRNSLKRGAGWRAGLPVEEQGAFDRDADEALVIDEALSKLERTDPRKAEVVMLRYFAGLTVDETAEALELSPRTVDSDWRFARVWLKRELS
ncbi:MAG: sigma-70 family RNA polymerase sigma factor [Planctomycetota bacterium]